ncbi:glycosyltransferase family 2 protein [Zymomonas mobilis]|uniref:glycosyltransferase family 2 protein n=1 Tax=Zymomonas mobilis TaxID=542 RepID=UPI0011503763|nr:glycosyltransferase [Zymomonas mobilis]
MQKKKLSRFRGLTKIDLAYHNWRQNNPLPRLKDKEIVPLRILALLSPNVIQSPDYFDCIASLQSQRGCTVETVSLPLSQFSVVSEPYDVVFWIRMATIFEEDYGQIAYQKLSEGYSLFYADHDTKLSSILHECPFFKPDFSPELLNTVDYLAAGCAFRPYWMDGQINIDDNFIYEKIKHLSRAKVKHLPLCLSHLTCPNTDQFFPPQSPIKFSINEFIKDKKITIIIPTAFYGSYLKNLLKSLHLTTKEFSNKIEIVIITNCSPSKSEEFLKNCPIRHKVIYYKNDFNYSGVNNKAVRETDGEILIFLNDDIELQDSHWLPDMLMLLQRPKSGAVGSLLRYPDNTIQHAGCLIGMNGGVGHIGVGLPVDSNTYHGIITAQREVSAVTGACLAIRRDVFLEVGMFDENLPFSFNDIALCLQLKDLGYTNYITTRSHIIHHESRSRGYDTTAHKYQTNREYFLYARSKYPSLRESDPYYNPNLDLSSVYMGYASLSEMQRKHFLYPRTQGCLVIIAQRMDYDQSAPIILDTLAQLVSCGKTRVVIAGENETYFSRKCHDMLSPSSVLIKSINNLQNILLNAPEYTLLLDLNLLELTDGLPSSLPVIIFYIQNKKFFYRLFWAPHITMAIIKYTRYKSK